MSGGGQGAREEVFHGALVFPSYICHSRSLGLQVKFTSVGALRLQGYPRQDAPGFQKIPKDPGMCLP